MLADDSDGQRPRAGSAARGRPRCRGAERQLHDAAPAAGGRAVVRGMAGGALPATGEPCDEPDPPGARRGNLRQPLRPPLPRRGPVRRAAGQALRGRVAPPGPEPARRFRPGLYGLRATAQSDEPVLTAFTRLSCMIFRPAG